MCECPDLYEEKVVKKSRKDHQCVCCFRKIRKGSSYTAIQGMWNGEFDRYAAHNRCLRVYRHLSENDSCCGMAFQETLEVLHEHTQYNRIQRRLKIKKAA